MKVKSSEILYLPCNAKNHTLEIIMNKIKELIQPLHPSAYPFVIGTGIISLLLALIWDFLGFAGLLVFLWMIAFFRKPDRIVPQREGLVIAPLSGVVTSVTENSRLPDALDSDDDRAADFTKVTIAPSLLDTHVLRYPFEGKILKDLYKSASLLTSAFDKKSDEDEKVFLLLETSVKDKSYQFGLVVTADYYMKNIDCQAEQGQKILAGEAFGFIRFTGHVDLYVSKGVHLRVNEGQKLVDGESILADITSKEKAFEVTRR